MFHSKECLSFLKYVPIFLATDTHLSLVEVANTTLALHRFILIQMHKYFNTFRFVGIFYSIKVSLFLMRKKL